MSHTIKVLTTGECLGTIVSNVTNLPDLLLTSSAQPAKHRLHDVFGCLGGAEFNFAATLAQLSSLFDGKVEVAFAGKVGNDIVGKVVYEKLQELGINTEHFHLVEDELTGGYNRLRTDDGKRSVEYARDHSPSAKDPLPLNADIMQEFHHFHTTGITLALSDRYHDVLENAFAYAKANGISTSFDPNFRPALHSSAQKKENLIKFMNRADILFVGDQDLAGIYSREITENDLYTMPAESLKISFPNLFNQTGQTIILKCGSLGSREIVDGKEIAKVQAFKPKVNDTVGAGDAADAGGMLAILMSMDPEQHLNLANAMGALAVQEKGDCNLRIKQTGKEFLAQLGLWSPPLPADNHNQTRQLSIEV